MGIVSEYFRNHSVWKLNISGWLRRLDRQKFRLFGYHTGKRRDAATTEAQSLCRTFRPGSAAGRPLARDNPGRMRRIF